jgi:hypothetical protein
MSIPAINWAYKIKAGSARNKAVLAALANHANDDGKCWPFIRTLKAETELGERAVQLALADLKKRRLISRQPQHLDGTKYRRNSEFTLHLDAVQDGAGDAPYGAADSPYGAGDAPPMVQEMHPHGAGDAPHIEPSLNHKEVSNSAPSLRSAGDGVPAVAKREAGKKGTRIPPDWRPDDDLIAFAHAKGWADERIQETADEFVDHWKGVPGAPGTKLDWPATFRNRIRYLTERRQQPGRNRRTGDEQIAGAYANAIVNERRRASETVVQ